MALIDSDLGDLILSLLGEELFGISNLDNTKLVATQQEKGYVRCITRGDDCVKANAAPYFLTLWLARSHAAGVAIRLLDVEVGEAMRFGWMRRIWEKR